MDDILRQDLLSGQPVGEPVRGLRVASVELVERAGVAGRETAVEPQVLAILLAHVPVVSTG